MSRPLSRRRFLAGGTAAAVGLGVPVSLRSSAAAWRFAADEPFDLLIVGGTLIDGSGEARHAGDVGIRGGRLAAIGELAGRPTKRTLQAAGLVVSPGFIDIHTHSDRTLLRDGLAQSAVRQGATTHVIGNCGSSPAPLPQPTTEYGRSFRSYGEYLQALADSGVSINIAGLVGHNLVRATAMGYANRSPNDTEMARMKDLIDEAMRSGAVGMSTGLVSPPGTFSKTSELIELAGVVARHGGTYASHIRGEAGSLIDAVGEAITIGQRARLPVEISHHKAAGKENWGKTRITLLMIEDANREPPGVRVDVYPYHAGSAGLSQLIPPWAHEGGIEKMLERLRDPAVRPRVVRDMKAGTPNWANFFQIDWNDIQITRVTTEANRRWVGRRVAEVAKDRGISGIDACIDLLIEEQAGVGMINFIMDEEEMRRVLRHRYSMVGSDGTAVSREWAEGSPHPRFYGCFPRVLGRYVRELGVLTLEQAIHKMTSMQAVQLGLADRGLLKVGFAADVVIFDPQTVIDRATFDEPHHYPEGIETVIVNGDVVVHRGEHTNARPGRILRPQRA